MHCTPCLLILQCLTLLLTSTVCCSQTSTHYVGERFSFPCTHGGEIPGHWFINGVDTNVIAAQFEDTIEVVNGEFNYDGTLRCEGGLSYSMKAYGLFGVSPSPLNCSSTDDTTNTCTVYASNKTSLTVCADFARQPSDAPRFATIHETEWSSDTDRWLWYCDPECTRNSAAVSVDITPSNEWGTCAQVESIQENVVLTFSVLATPYLGTGVGATLHSQAGIYREVKFSIQVGQPPSTTSPSPTPSTTSPPTSSSSQTPQSTTSSQPLAFSPSVGPASAASSTSVPEPSTSSSSQTMATHSVTSSPIRTSSTSVPEEPSTSSSSSPTAVTDTVAPSPTGSGNPLSTASVPNKPEERTTVSAPNKPNGAITIPFITVIVVIVTVTAVPAVAILLLLCQVKCLRMKLAKYATPSPQQTSRETKLQTFKLHFNDSVNAIESGLPNTSTLQTLLATSNMTRSSAVFAPDNDYFPEAVVTEGKPPHIRELPSPKDSSFAPGFSTSLP